MDARLSPSSISREGQGQLFLPEKGSLFTTTRLWKPVFKTLLCQ